MNLPRKIQDSGLMWAFKDYGLNIGGATSFKFDDKKLKFQSLG